MDYVTTDNSNSSQYSRLLFWIKSHFRLTYDVLPDRILTVGGFGAFYQPVPEPVSCSIREHISIKGFIESALGPATGIGTRHGASQTIYNQFIKSFLFIRNHCTVWVTYNPGPLVSALRCKTWNVPRFYYSGNPDAASFKMIILKIKHTLALSWVRFALRLDSCNYKRSQRAENPNKVKIRESNKHVHNVWLFKDNYFWFNCILDKC